MSAQLPGGRPGGIPNSATLERRMRITAQFHIEAATADVRRAERAVERVRRGRGDLGEAVAELRRARLALAEMQDAIWSAGTSR